MGALEPRGRNHPLDILLMTAWECYGAIERAIYCIKNADRLRVKTSTEKKN